MAGAAVVMVLARRDTHGMLKLVDWDLLLFFAALFIVVDGLSHTRLPDAFYLRLQPVFGSSAAAFLALDKLASDGVNCTAVGRGHCDAVDRFKPPLVRSDSLWCTSAVHDECNPMMSEWKGRSVERLARLSGLEARQDPHTAPSCG